MTLMDISKFNPPRCCAPRVYIYLTQNHACVIAGLSTQQLSFCVSSLSKHEVIPILVTDMCRKVCCILDMCFLHMPTTFLHTSVIKLNLCQICTVLLIFFSVKPKVAHMHVQFVGVLLYHPFFMYCTCCSMGHSILSLQHYAVI